MVYVSLASDVYEDAYRETESKFFLPLSNSPAWNRKHGSDQNPQ